MFSRRGRVFPGVFLTMLLAGPALAAPPPTLADPSPRKAVSQDHRRPSHSARALKSGKSSNVKAASATTRRRPATPAAATTAFIDDGFCYSEDTGGGVAWKQTGVASWYGGRRWQGNLTASGAKYEETALTAAHATLPLGSHVRVTLANSDRSIIVTITDRPGTRSRIIDLSRSAAEALGILSRGVAFVTLSPS